MKNKFLVLTLCFSIIFSSINFNKSYANDIDSLVVDGGVISAPMLAVVSTLALGTGIAIKNIDDIYSVGTSFYNYFKYSWSSVVDTFNKNVLLTATGVVTVGSAFLELITQFLPSYNNSPLGLVGYWGEIPIYDLGTETFPHTVSFDISSGAEVRKDVASGVYLHFLKANAPTYRGTIDLVGASSNGKQNVHIDSPDVLKVYGIRGYSDTEIYCLGYKYPSDVVGRIGLRANKYYDLVSSPNVYDDTIINDNKNENGDLPIYVPGDLSSLPGISSNDVFVNNGTSIPYDPPFGGVVTIPGIENPSIDVDTDTTFPGVNDTPTDTPFANITEYIIGLVVPSDTYWNDSFNSLHTNFTSSFPMVDMSSFNSLAVNGKPFPNIDINIMGAKGRVVNGDTVNSIVDWLRPIIAGFVFLCLMFFNYRKLYKLIRNSEPFEGIGKVENHAN